MAGFRDSEWKVLRRCLKLLVCLQHAPALAEELQEISRDDETISDTAARKRFEKDLERLRSKLACEIDYDRKTGVYALHRVGQPLVDLPPESLRGLAFLQATFQEETPMGHEIGLLVRNVLNLLPEQRLQALQRERRLIDVDLQPRDEDAISDAVWSAVQAACDRRVQLQFDYYSPSHADGVPRVNLVEPHRYFFDRGHYYLRAFCLEVNGPKGRWERREFVSYRIGRIQNPQVLPTRFVHREPNPRYLLIYELIPQIARRGVTEHFPGSQITRQEDDSAIVEAQVENLFMSLRTLLHYGPGCRVIGGEEALTQMRAIAKAMYQLYF